MPPPDAPTYWLMPGETPLGPYRTEEILAQIKAGFCSWTTKASLVGSQAWIPLNQLLMLAPVAKLATGSDAPPAPAVSPASSQPQRSLFSSSRIRTVIVTVVGITLIYWLWNSVSGGWSLSVQQVCQAFVSAKTVTEARQYVTPNLYAALDVLATQPDGGSDDGNLELSAEQPAPTEAGGGYYVGYRAHFRDINGMMIIEGVFHVMNQSGWKVHDWFLFSVNGQSIEPPLSIAREYEFFRDPQHPTVVTRQATDAKKQAQQWHSNIKIPPGAGAALAKSGLGKWLGAIIGVVVAGIVGLFHKRQATSAR